MFTSFTEQQTKNALRTTITHIHTAIPKWVYPESLINQTPSLQHRTDLLIYVWLRNRHLSNKIHSCHITNEIYLRVDTFPTIVLEPNVCIREKVNDNTNKHMELYVDIQKSNNTQLTFHIESGNIQTTIRQHTKYGTQKKRRQLN